MILISIYLNERKKEVWPADLTFFLQKKILIKTFWIKKIVDDFYDLVLRTDANTYRREEK